VGSFAREIHAMNFMLGLLLGSATLLGSQTPTSHATSYLISKELGNDGTLRTKVERYVPQPGDLILYDEESDFWNTIYRLVGTHSPDHSGIVVCAGEGQLASLEAAPDDGMLIGFRVGMLDLQARLRQFQGKIYIRRLKQPLDLEHWCKLTEFAQDQCGKPYSLGRFLLQATPFRCRDGLRARFFGRTILDRRSWLCSELVVAAGTVAGLFDPNVHKANMIYPCDLLDDLKYDLRGTWYPGAVWSENPPPAK
jgi:hypothetical protein